MLFSTPSVPRALRSLPIGLAACSLGASLLLGGCADETPPRFTGELTLALTEDQLAATWPAASDDVRVEAYLVHVDGAAVGRLGRDTLSYTLHEVEERTTRAVRVTAVDAAGNESAPLDARLAIPDRTAPRFPADARTTVTGDLQQVTLRWPPATDEGVVHYEVRSGERVLGTVTEPTFTLPRAAVDADFSAETRVVAIDDADNRSTALVSRWSQFFSFSNLPAAADRLEIPAQWGHEERLIGLMNEASRDVATELFGDGVGFASTGDVAGAAVSQPASEGCISPCGEGRIGGAAGARRE